MDSRTKFRRLLVVGIAALTIAGAIAGRGIVERAHSAQEVARWTEQQAVPTVSLAKLGQGNPGTVVAAASSANKAD